MKRLIFAHTHKRGGERNTLTDHVRGGSPSSFHRKGVSDYPAQAKERGGSYFFSLEKNRRVV